MNYVCVYYSFIRNSISCKLNIKHRRLYEGRLGIRFVGKRRGNANNKHFFY